MSQQVVEQRSSRQFWAAHEGDAMQVTGYDCGRDYDGKVWWVPELGYSLTIGFSLFDTEKEAIEAELANLSKRIGQLTEKRDALAVRHALLGS